MTSRRVDLLGVFPFQTKDASVLSTFGDTFLQDHRNVIRFRGAHLAAVHIAAIWQMSIMGDDIRSGQENAREVSVSEVSLVD